MPHFFVQKTSTMNILLCTPAFEVRVVGPAVFSHLFFTTNAQNPTHDCRILTSDTTVETDRIFKLNDNYPPRLAAFNFIFRQVFFYRALRRVQRKFPFDVLIFIDARHGWLSRILFSNDVKIVGLINDYQIVDPFLTMHGTRRRLWFFKYFVRFFEKKAARSLDLIVACSKDLKRRIEVGYGVNSEKVMALFHGFDIEKNPFKARQRPFKMPIKLLFIKSNLRRGAMDILAKALAKLPDVSFVLTIIGPPNSLKSAIERLFSEVPNVELRFIGFANTETVYQEMRSNDILCTPSRDEALGIANAEGLASGISVVSTRVSGIIEVLDGGKNGWLAEPENADDLAEKLKVCIEADPSVSAEKSRLGRLFVEQKFDYQQLNAHFLERCAALFEK
jgi:colanic acid/amylovoran biosynthesis glycosyltransferase